MRLAHVLMISSFTRVQPIWKTPFFILAGVLAFIGLQSQMSFASESQKWIAPQCKAINIKEANVFNRAKSVVFPDGREIVIVGHIHGTRQLHNLEAIIGSKRIEQLSDKEFSHMLLSIEEENIKIESIKIFASDREPFSVLSDAKKDLLYIKHKLTPSLNKKQIEFMGIEASKEFLDSYLGTYFENMEQLVNEFNRRKQDGRIKMPTQQFENILLSASNAPLYYAFKNRETPKSIPVVGIEDKNAVDYNLKTKPTGEEFENSLKAYDEYFERLPENQKKNLEKDENVSHFLKNLAALLLDAEFGQISSMVEFHQRLKNMGSVPPLVTHGPAFKGLISTAEKSVKAAIARDTASAHRLTQIKKSGVYFVGQQHLKNISTYLEKNCTKEVKMEFVGDAYHSVESHVFDSAQ